MTKPARLARPDTPVPVLDDVVAVAKAVADVQRAAVLRALKEDSFGVLELCRILDTAQPALSHHLKVLHQAGLVARRREGNTIFYRRAPATGELHAAVLAAIDEVPLPEPHARGIDAVHLERSRRSEAFFAEHAAQFATQQARICEHSVYAGSVLEAVDRLGLGEGTALEIGPGDGELLAALAGRFDDVVGIDSAAAMLQRASARVAGLPNVRLEHRDFNDLPARPRYQLVLAAMVVHHQPSPPRFFRRAAERLERDGVLILVELCRHDQEWARSACGDLWLGFEAAELTQWAANAGLGAGESQFLAQRNGFRIQIHTYHKRTR